MTGDRQIDPGGGGKARQMRRFSLPNTGLRELPREAAMQRFQAIGRTVEHRDWQHLRDLAPASPAVETRQIIGAHQPHKLRFWIKIL